MTPRCLYGALFPAGGAGRVSGCGYDVVMKYVTRRN